jgi:hypothetical protein
MASLAIPEPVAIGLSKIAALSEEAFEEVLSALNNIPLKIRQYAIFDDSAFKLQSVSPDEERAIKDAVFSLYVSRITNDASLLTFVDDIAESLRSAKRGEMEWTHSEDSLNAFKARLLKLLSVQTLELVAKAHDVLIRHAEVFSKTRIITDIRPVFGDTIGDTPPTAVIVHMLNISYSQAGRRQEIAIALDTKDLQQLKEMVKRAEDKEETLKSFIASTNTTYVEVV